MITKCTECNGNRYSILSPYKQDMRCTECISKDENMTAICCLCGERSISAKCSKSGKCTLCVFSSGENGRCRICGDGLHILEVDSGMCSGCYYTTTKEGKTAFESGQKRAEQCLQLISDSWLQQSDMTNMRHYEMNVMDVLEETLMDMIDDSQGK